MVLGNHGKNETKAVEAEVTLSLTLDELEFIANTMSKATIQISQAFKAVKTLKKIQEGYLKLKNDVPQK